jgi:hypothetical protein
MRGKGSDSGILGSDILVLRSVTQRAAARDLMGYTEAEASSS